MINGLWKTNWPRYDTLVWKWPVGQLGRDRILVGYRDIAHELVRGRARDSFPGHIAPTLFAGASMMIGRMVGSLADATLIASSGGCK